MPRKNNCLARQMSDQMICDACGLVWDVNDPEPPTCGKVDRRTKKVKALLSEPQNVPGRLPPSLSDELAAEMARVYHANASEGLGGRIRGMHAAYRLLLDRVDL